MKALLLTLLVFASVVFSACTEDDSVPTAAVPSNGPLEILPMKVGNWWGYRYSLILFGDTAHQDYVDTLRVVDEETHGGQTWYAQFEPDAVGFRFLFRNTDSGLVRYDGNLVEMALKYPGAVGDRHKEIYYSTQVHCTIVSTDTLITVPAGTFECYYYLISDSSGNPVIQAFYCPGVGEVKYISHRHSDSIELAELAGYYVQ